MLNKLPKENKQLEKPTQKKNNCEIFDKCSKKPIKIKLFLKTSLDYVISASLAEKFTLNIFFSAESLNII